MEQPSLNNSCHFLSKGGSGGEIGFKLLVEIRIIHFSPYPHSVEVPFCLLSDVNIGHLMRQAVGELLTFGVIGLFGKPVSDLFPPYTRSTLPQVPSASLLEFSILASGTSRTPFDEFQFTVAGAGVVAAARTTSSKQRRVLCNAQHPSQLAPFVAEHQDGAVQGAVCRPGHVPSLQIWPFGRGRNVLLQPGPEALAPGGRPELPRPKPRLLGRGLRVHPRLAPRPISASVPVSKVILYWHGKCEPSTYGNLFH